MKSSRHALIAGLCVFLLPLCSSAKEATARIVDTARQEKFEDQAAAIRQEMTKGGRFEFVTAMERAEVDAQLQRIAALLSQRAGQRLDDDDQLDIYAAQENANAILTRRDGRRLICEYSAPTGSNRKVKQCATYAERTRAHNETRNYMRETLGKNLAEPQVENLRPIGLGGQ